MTSYPLGAERIDSSLVDEQHSARALREVNAPGIDKKSFPIQHFERRLVA
jgi:hypothetical protein